MKIVNDTLFYKTLKNIKDLIDIADNPYFYKKKILINLMPSFAFKQLVIFMRLGEYLKKEGFYVDYFVCNQFFNHCDMVKMNDSIDRNLACERCLIVEKKLNLFFKKDLVEKKISHLDTTQYLENSIKRFCGLDVNFQKYIIESQDNLLRSAKLHLEYDFCITLNHFQNYSIAPLLQQFKEKILYLGIEAHDGDKLSLFANDKELIFQQNLNLTKVLRDRILLFLQQRIQRKHKVNLKYDKKIAVLFPNVLEDSFFNSSGKIFNSMYAWLEETVRYLIKNDFFVIVKSHPVEKQWNPMTKTIDYFEDTQENLLLVDEEYGAYDLMEIADYVVTYNGTVFFESLVQQKQVVLGGQIGDIQHTTKEEYYMQFFHYKPYNFEKALEYAYKLYFTKAFSLEMIDKTLEYPYIKKEVTEEKAFAAVVDIINDSYELKKYINDFISIY